MPTWIHFGWQRDSDMSSGRKTTDGCCTSHMPRCICNQECFKRCSQHLLIKNSAFALTFAYPFIFFSLYLSSTVQCPAHDVRYDSSGVILSPGWPESYPNLQMCSWSVTVEKGYNVTITFESFHTEREFDVLEIFDGKKNTFENPF